MLSGNFIYGMTRTGGTGSKGVLFQYNLTNNVYTLRQLLGLVTGTVGRGQLEHA